jgi:Protein of unknown function (DUF551)
MKMNEWISVDFAVPPDSRKVLVSTLNTWKMGNGEIRERKNIYIAEMKRFKNGKVKWRDSRGGYIVHPDDKESKVTHWMPLPQYA